MVFKEQTATRAFWRGSPESGVTQRQRKCKKKSEGGKTKVTRDFPKVGRKENESTADLHG